MGLPCDGLLETLTWEMAYFHGWMITMARVKETRRQGGTGTCKVPGVLFSVLLFFSNLLPRNGNDGQGTEKHTVATLCGTIRGFTLVL